MRHLFTSGIVLLFLGAALVLSACGSQNDSPTASPSPNEISTSPPTPSVDVLQVNAASEEGERLRVTIPALSLLARAPGESVQILVVLAGQTEGYSYALYPANRAGVIEDQIDLSNHPIELNLTETTAGISLWVLALHNVRYQASENFGVDSLATTLALSFKNWLADGNPTDDPLAAIVANSNGALFEWFAAIDVLGQATVDFPAESAWNQVLVSAPSDDGGINIVYSSEVINSAVTPTSTPTIDLPTETPSPTPTIPRPASTDPALPGYGLTVNEDFESVTPASDWFRGQGETYINDIVDGSYQIQLTAIREREFSQSWGSIEDRIFEDYRVEAEVQLVESDITDGRTGVWFNYQDDFNFLYFGISNKGEYRVALIARNQTVTEIQDWTAHPAITPGNAVNLLAIESHSNGTFTLYANGTELLIFEESTFPRGSVAFFCYAKSVPATCRLNNLKVWEQVR